ncbi:MAG: hypothetical protein RLZZ175_2769 [Bacteroidota bacterium]|jgi:hypothetical protein
MAKIIKCPKTNKISFFKDGNQLYDFKIKGNVIEFKDGEVIIL